MSRSTVEAREAMVCCWLSTRRRRVATSGGVDAELRMSPTVGESGQTERGRRWSVEGMEVRPRSQSAETEK